MCDLSPEVRETLSPKEFVKLSGLSIATVRRYLEDGRLPHMQLGPRCRVLIPYSVLAQLASSLSGDDGTQSSSSPSVPAKATKSGLPGPSPHWLNNS